MKLDLSHDEIFQYLLGTLSPERAEEIERQILEDSDFHQEVNICERELVDRYVQNDLTSVERSLVEQRFIASDLRRQQLLFAAALQKKTSATRPSRARELRHLLLGSSSIIRYKWAVAALLLLSMLLGLQDFRLARQLRRAEEQLAVLNTQLENAAGGPNVPLKGNEGHLAVLNTQLENGAGRPNVPLRRNDGRIAVLNMQLNNGAVVATLSPTERGQTSGGISVPTGVRAVQIRLSVPEDWQGKTLIELMNDRSEVIATAADIRAQRIGNARFLMATFAVDQLPDGNYFLRATAKDSPRHSDYAFTINRQ